MDEQAFFFPSSAHITVNDGACFPDGAGDCHNHLLNPVLPVTLWQKSKVALSQILSWKNSPRVSQKQLRGSHPWLSTDSILRVVKVQETGQCKNTEEAQRDRDGSARENRQIVANLQPE